jgi:tRNA-specific 2-thiouridylase
MSGGVDSSVAAAVCLEQGHQVAGVTFRTGRSRDAAPAAKAVADALGIEHHVVDISSFFERMVVDQFKNEYRAGRTPNPCIRCNRFLKFGRLLEIAHSLGYSDLATGHYARLDKGVLYRGADRRKDQSYFLYVLYHSRPESIHFPLGELTKEKTRAYAARLDLPSARASESQDICFVPDGDYGSILADEAGETGPIVDVGGKEIGRHQGVWRYTIGQRKGLGALGRRMFVKAIDPVANTIVAAPDEGLFTHMVAVGECAFGSCTPRVGDEYLLQIRYRGQPTRATILGTDGASVVARAHEPLRAVAPGQSAVLYRGDMVVGGGTIVSSW